jgi:2-oxo-3-hexenedioate decarboxylase
MLGEQATTGGAGFHHVELGAAAATGRRLVQARLDAGERTVGVKAALVTPESQLRLGAPGPLWGVLTDAMQIHDGILVPAPPMEQRIEPEIVFALGDDLVGPGVDCEHVRAAMAALHAGLEIPASVGKARTATEFLASNAAAHRFVLGPPVTEWRALDLTALSVTVAQDGEVIRTGTSAAVLGHPARAVAAIANAYAAFGLELTAGTLVFTGGMCPAIAPSPGTHLTAAFDHLGSIDLDIH